MSTLTEAIEKLQAFCLKGDAAVLYREMFTEDAALCGEGAKDITVGAGVLAALTEMLKVTPQLSIRAVRTTELGESAAVTWLEWSSPPAGGEPGETLTFRSLTAWRKRGASWLIAADMYGMGPFGA